MATVSYPGVYMQEVASGVRPIQAASTSTAAFVGVAERGEIGIAHKVFNFTEFATAYGGFLGGHYLAHAVFQFFNNGGSQCYVVRVAPGAQTADVTLRDRADAPQDALTVSASSPGVWGNHLQLRIDSASGIDPENTFALEVHRFAPGDDEPQSLERFENLSMNPQAPAAVATVVNRSSRYVRVTPAPLVPDTTNEIAGFLEGAAVVADGDLLEDSQRRLRISMHGDAFHEIELAGLDSADLSTLVPIQTALQLAIRSLVPQRASVSVNPYEEATVSIEGDGDRLRITSGVASVDSTVAVLPAEISDTDAAGVLGLTGMGVRMVHGSSQMRPPDTGPEGFYLVGDAPLGGAVSAATLGTDGTTPQDIHYRDALPALDTIRDVSLLAVPGVGSAAMAADGVAYCRNRPLSDMFFVADMAWHDETLVDVEAWRANFSVPNSHGAVYFPWLYMLDPNGGPEPIRVPPSGYVAGMYAQTDARRGVWKSPAGVGANLAGAVGLVTELTDVQHGGLNVHPKSVCVIRRFPATGLVVWGARTLSSDPEYRYISVRRMAIFLRVSIFNGIQWAVFEPNDEPLWVQLRLNLNAFMMTLFRQGAFQGSKPDAAFFVKVDAETTTPADIDNGVVNVLVGFAPLKPAEFVIVRIAQRTGQSS